MSSGVAASSTSTSPAKPSSAVARGRDGVAGAARLLLDSRDLPSVVGVRACRATRRRRPGRRRPRAPPRAPSRPCAARAAGAGASASPSACACRARRPSRLLRGRASAHRCDGWGARIRTWDRGTKTRCLTTWLRPTTGDCASASLLEVRLGRRSLAEQQDQRDRLPKSAGDDQREAADQDRD